MPSPALPPLFVPLDSMLEVDMQSASRFLDALSGSPDQPHAFQVFPEGDTDAFPVFRYGTLDELGQTLVTSNNRGAGVSVTISETDGLGRTVGNMVAPRALFIDLDDGDRDEDGILAIPRFPLKAWPTAVVRTRRGYHFYWWLERGVSWDDWEKAQKALARRYGGDPKMADRTKCLRVPGFWHHKESPPVAMELAHVDDRRWIFEDLVETMRLRLDEPAKGGDESTRGDRPQWVLGAIRSMPQSERLEQYADWVAQESPAIEGQRGHDALVRIIKMAWNFGVEWELAWPIVEDYNDRCDPPWRPRALRTQFDSATRSRFESSSWESMLWAPDREIVRREGPQPPEVDAEHSTTSARRTIHRSSEAPENAPPPTDESPGGRRIVRSSEAPEAPPPDARGPKRKVVRRSSSSPSPPPPDDDAPPLPPEPPEYGGGDHGGGGGDHDGPGGDHDGPGGLNGHVILSPDSPLDSAKIFVRSRYARGSIHTMGLFRRGWYAWDESRWEGYSKEKVNACLYDFGAHAKHQVFTKGGARLKPFNPNSKKVNDMRHALESLVFLDDAMRPPCWITKGKDQPPPKELVACANGLLHLPTSRFLGRRADYFNLTALGVDYNENAAQPHRWLRFLDELWPDDEESHRLLQEWFGLCLVPDTSYHKALLVQGAKRSGKGTIARVLNALHGANNSVAWPRLDNLVGRFGLESLLDKTIAVIPDLRVSHRMDTQGAIEVFLSITGEDWLQVERKNKTSIEVQIPVRFLVLTNVTPRLPDAGGAFASRVMALKLETSFFGREDRQLLDKLRKELPGILLWSIEGWRRLTKRGHFVQPGTGAEILQELAHLSTPIQAFVEDTCALESQAQTPTDELFTAWRRWCEAEGRSAVGEKATFVRNMRAAFPELRNTRPSGPDGTRLRALAGIRVVYREEQRKGQRSFGDDF